MIDILLLTESKLASDFNKYEKVVKISGAEEREDVLPHDIHLNISLLGTKLLEYGYRVTLLDNFLHFDSQYKKLEQELQKNPFAVGLSTTFLYDQESVKTITDLIRHKSSTSYIILGGPSLLQFPALISLGDISVLYDGEDVLPKIIKSLKNKRKGLKKIPGIFIKEDNKLIFTGERNSMDINNSPIPDWSLLKRSRDLVYPLETQRGCPYACKYCTYPIYNLKGGGFRLKEKENVIKELKNNYTFHGIYRYRFCDSNFTAPPKRALELCNLIVQANLKIEWSCYGRVDNMNDSLAFAMKEAGCKVIFVGLESGSDLILKNMNKRFTTEDIYKGIESIKKAGLYISGSFIVGFPGETELTVEETKNLIKTCKLDTYIASLFWLDRNAPIWKEQELYNLSGWGMEWAHSTMDSKKGSILLEGLLSDVFHSNGTSLGSDFDIVTLVNLGLSYKKALEFIKNRHIVTLSQRLAEEGEPNPYISSERLREINTRHLESILFLSKGYKNIKERYNLDFNSS